MKNYFLTPEQLPSGFTYPDEFKRIVALELVKLEPWDILEAVWAERGMHGLSQRYPKRNLIPFASRQDCDDVACWDGQDVATVYIIHDFASPGWEQRATFPTFYDWFRSAMEDCIEFGLGELPQK